MWQYSTPLQFAKIILVSQLLQAAGAPYANLCVYMAGEAQASFKHSTVLLYYMPF
jgi:hypothetical protein